MRELIVVASDCMKELKSIGVPFGKVTRWRVNSTAKNRWGLCKKSFDGYEISISSQLLADNSNLDGLKNTIIHELLHTVKGGHGHTGEWKRWANFVNYKLGYNIKRTSSSEEKGVAEEFILNRLKEYKYIIECPTCHRQWQRMKMTSTIQHPEMYHCPKCKSNLVRVK